MVEGRPMWPKTHINRSAIVFRSKRSIVWDWENAIFRLDEALKAVDVAAEALNISGTPTRYRAMLYALHARSLLKATVGVEDPNDCARTAPPVHEWLLAAQKSVSRRLRLRWICLKYMWCSVRFYADKPC